MQAFSAYPWYSFFHPAPFLSSLSSLLAHLPSLAVHTFHCLGFCSGLILLVRVFVAFQTSPCWTPWLHPFPSLALYVQCSDNHILVFVGVPASSFTYSSKSPLPASQVFIPWFFFSASLTQPLFSVFLFLPSSSSLAGFIFSQIFMLFFWSVSFSYCLGRLLRALTSTVPALVSGTNRLQSLVQPVTAIACDILSDREWITSGLQGHCTDQLWACRKWAATIRQWQFFESLSFGRENGQHLTE